MGTELSAHACSLPTEPFIQPISAKVDDAPIDPSRQKAEAGISLNLRSAWSTRDPVTKKKVNWRFCIRGMWECL